MAYTSVKPRRGYIQHGRATIKGSLAFRVLPMGLRLVLWRRDSGGGGGSGGRAGARIEETCMPGSMTA